MSPDPQQSGRCLGQVSLLFLWGWRGRKVFMGMGTELGAEKDEEGKESVEWNPAAWQSHRVSGVEGWGPSEPLKTSVTYCCNSQA